MRLVGVEVFLKKFKIHGLLLVLIIATIVNPVLAVEKPDASVTAPYPAPIAKAALLMDASSGRVLYEKNSSQRLFPASVTKIMTAMLVVEDGDLDRMVEVSPHASQTPECSVYLQPGERLTRRQLLYAAMLHSANDASTALAESIAGSEAAFIDLMNTRARQLGMANTHFCNPHGLQNQDHYTSAYDLAILTRQALTYQYFSQVVSTQNLNIPWYGHDEPRYLWNQNRLLYRYPGSIGVKTGYTKQAGNCVVGAAQKGDMTLIAVALDSTTVYEDLAGMLDYGFTNYRMQTLARSDDLMAPLKVAKGHIATVTAKSSCDLKVAAGAGEQFAYDMLPVANLTAPLKAGDPVGSCRILLNGIPIGSVALYSCDEVPFKAGPEGMLASIAAIWDADASRWYVLSVFLLILMLFRKIKQSKQRKKNRDYEIRNNQYVSGSSRNNRR